MYQINPKCLMLLDKITNKLFRFSAKDKVDDLDPRVEIQLVFLSPSKQH